MPCDVPPPPMEHTEEYQNSLELDDDDIEIIDAEELNEFEEHHEVPSSVQDDSRLTFNRHSDEVFCCGIDNRHGYAVSGGENKECFVWNLTTGEEILHCTGHDLIVIYAQFNPDSSLLATGTMSLVQVWDMEKKEKTAFDFREPEILWLQWVPGNDHLVIGTECYCFLWNIHNNQFREFSSHYNTMGCGKVIGERLIAGDEDGFVRVYNLKLNALNIVMDLRCHNFAVTAIDCDKNGYILSGSADSTATLTTFSLQQILTKVECGELMGHDDRPDPVASLALLTSHQSFVTGTVNGSIAVWDIFNGARKLHIKQEGCVMKMICHRDAPCFFTSGEDEVVRLYDSRTGEIESSYKGHEAGILDFDLTSDGQTLLTASRDGTCKVFSVGLTE